MGSCGPRGHALSCGPWPGGEVAGHALRWGGLHAISHRGVALDICASCKRPRAFDLHNNAAIRCTSGRGPTSAVRVVFDAQEHPLLGKIKVPEVV